MQGFPCLLVIGQKYEALTVTEQRIASYILAHAEEIPQLSVSELAAKAGSVQSAVIRLCKSLGYTGFTQLKLSLSAELSKNKQLNYTPYIDPTDTSGMILDKIFSANVKTLHDTAEHIDRAALAGVIDALYAASSVYIYGAGTSTVFVEELQYRLMQLGYRAFGFSDVPSMKISTMNIGEKDVAFGISHGGRTISTIEALRLAREAGGTTVCLTSYTDSPITHVSDYALAICSDEIQYPIEALSARIAHMSVIDTIITALSAKNYEETVRRAKLTKAFVETVRYPK